jgi:hypothetical protein
MESGESKGNRSTHGNSSHDRLLYAQVIHERDHVFGEAGDRKAIGVAQFRVSVTAAFQGDPAYSLQFRENIGGLSSIGCQPVLPNHRQPFAC